MGEFLALLRKTNGFTQQDVADKLNISNRTLSSWETDRTTPDILLLPSIADLYGVTVDELLRCERQPEQIETHAHKINGYWHFIRLGRSCGLYNYAVFSCATLG